MCSNHDGIEMVHIYEYIGNYPEYIPHDLAINTTQWILQLYKMLNISIIKRPIQLVLPIWQMIFKMLFLLCTKTVYKMSSRTVIKSRQTLYVTRKNKLRTSGIA